MWVVCKVHLKTTMYHIAVVAVGVLGKVGQCAPINCDATDCRTKQASPVSGPVLLWCHWLLKPSKPSLCQDQLYLNCLMWDMSYCLDSLIDIKCYLEKEHFQTKLNGKSGYDYVLMDDDSQLLMGFQWGGWWFVNYVLPFGWKIFLCIYQSLGMVATQESEVKVFHVASILMITIWDPGDLIRPILKSPDQSTLNWWQQPTM